MATYQDAQNRVERGFWIHLAVYALVVGGLTILNLNRNPDNLWVLWVAGGWGLGVLLHAFAFFTPDSRERMVHRTMSRMDRREERHGQRVHITQTH